VVKQLCHLEQLAFAHGLSRRQFPLFNTSLLPVVAAVVAMQQVVEALAGFLPITAVPL
jgi:hypothetical protein